MNFILFCGLGDFFLKALYWILGIVGGLIAVLVIFGLIDTLTYKMQEKHPKAFKIFNTIICVIFMVASLIISFLNIEHYRIYYFIMVFIFVYFNFPPSGDFVSNAIHIEETEVHYEREHKEEAGYYEGIFKDKYIPPNEWKKVETHSEFLLYIGYLFFAALGGGIALIFSIWYDSIMWLRFIPFGLEIIGFIISRYILFTND